jgi:hypothetical protein
MKRRRHLGWLLGVAMALTACGVKLAAMDANQTGGVEALLSVPELDNGHIKFKMDLDSGGAITYVSLSGSSYNLINNYDRGRQVQQSYYAGQAIDRRAEGQHSNWSPWRWNPIQVGDSYGHPSRILAWSNDGNTVYVKTRPLLWDMRNEQCQCNFETWATLSGNTIHVRNKLTTFRTDNRWIVTTTGQELPAVYAIGDLHQLYSYVGGAPYTGAPLTRISNNPPPFPPWPWTKWNAAEDWSACVNASGFGIGVLNRNQTEFNGGFYGRIGGDATSASTCYLSPIAAATLDKTSLYEYSYSLIVGSLGEIRQTVYALSDHGAPPPSNSPPSNPPPAATRRR